MLTERQERFCEEYLADANATRAAARAGYSEASAASAGSRLLKNGEVCGRIAALTERMGGEEVASAEEVLKTLTRILRREEREETVVSTSERTPLESEGKRTEYVTRKDARVVELKPKISDVNRAAELLGKRYGLYAERLEVEVTLPVIVDDVAAGGGESGRDG